MEYFGLTDIGKKRKNNQDVFSIDEISEGKVLLTVCDGMGGANGGEIASSLAISTYTKYFADHYSDSECDSSEKIFELLKNSVSEANNAVLKKAGEDSSLEGMGTTIVSAFLTGNAMYAVNVGDSRLYIYRNGGVEKISHDHSYVQFLVDIGELTEEEAKKSPDRNIITRAVGTESNLESDVFAVELDSDNKDKRNILLCSDGLTNYLKESTISKILAKNCSCEEKAKKLVAGANNGGGLDNITVIVANW